MLKRTCAPLATALAVRGFQAGRVLDPQLRSQLPPPLQRDESTVLKRLARSGDTLADTLPHYAIDDSMFLRYKQADIALARRSGRNMARHFLEKNAAQFAELNKECPPVAAWRPLRPLDQLECSEASLRLLIEMEQVGLSWQMYHKLKTNKDASLSLETKQSLLELLAYHAGGEPPFRDISPEEIYFAFKPLQVSRARWDAQDNPAMALYASMKPNSLAAKAAMLKAHQHHGSHADCLAIYAEVACDPQLDAESHNCALLATAASTASWQATLELFRRLPTLSTPAYRCLLNGLAVATKEVEDQATRAQLACSILAEMASRGLPRTLGVCTAALRAVYKDQLAAYKSPSVMADWLSNPGQPEACVGFLPSLLDSLLPDPPEPLDADCADDLAFFPAAGFLACRVYASPALSKQLDTLLHTGAFTSTLATFEDRRAVYDFHLINLICAKPSVSLDAAIRFFTDRILPCGAGQLNHVVRLMRKSVERQAVDRLPGLMLHFLSFVDTQRANILCPGYAFFRCAEICAQMFVHGHPATRDADFLADLRRCLKGFADALNNEIAYKNKKRREKDRVERRELSSSLTANSCATLLQLAARLPGAADTEREFSLQLSSLLSECLTEQRTSSLSYMLALMELATAMRASPRYEQRLVCQSVAELLDRVAHEFISKRTDKSDVDRLGRLAELAESASAYLEANGYQLTSLQAAAHHRLAKGAAELRDRGGDAASGDAAAAAAASNLDDESAWDIDDADSTPSEENSSSGSSPDDGTDEQR